MLRGTFLIGAVMVLGLTGCETTQAGNSVKSVGSSIADTVGGAAKGAVSLVNVNLSNVLNDLALDLKIDKANIPINAQIPITIAANICGVSINILSVSTGGSPNCTATGTSPELSQAVQQQMAANGSVGGGNQTGASGAAATTAGATTPGTTTTRTTTATGTTTSTVPTVGIGTTTTTATPTPSATPAAPASGQ